MALKDQGLFIAILCGVGVLAAGTLGLMAYRDGPTITSEVCSNCGLFRTRTVWQVPKTSVSLVWRSAITNSVVSVAIHEHNLAREWGHHWLVYEEIRPTPAPAPPVAPGGRASPSVSPPAPANPPLRPGRTLVYQYNSPDVARWIVALHRRSDRKTFAKWVRWLADTDLSPHVLGTAVRFRLQHEQLKEDQDFQRWLEHEEEKLVFGNRPQRE